MAAWKCLLAVWRVSWTLWVVFEVYWCQIHWKQTCKYHFTIYWLFSQWPVFGQKNMHFRLSVRCQLGVCWVSGGCQGPSGLCLRCINAKSIGKGLVDIILNKYRIFSQWPIFGQKRLQQGVSGGCLEGVWRVSWAPWIRSGYIYAQWIEKSFTDIIITTYHIILQWPIFSQKKHAF